MPVHQAAVQLAEELDLLGDYVLFGDWVPYEEWPNYLMEADVGLSLHPDTVEARLAFRSRVLDYVWAGLPAVVSRGDATSELVQDGNLGVVVDHGCDGAVADAVLGLLDTPRSTFRKRFSRAQAEMAWERAARPLVAFCRNPQRAADRPRSTDRSERSATQLTAPLALDTEELRRRVDALEWYHTLDLGHGIVTPGAYDHRPYLRNYGIPEDLRGKTALDVGAASGFFAFEMERRGARVTALDLPAWFDHDFGPRYQADKTPEEGVRYLRDPIMLARRALDSKIEKVEMTVYEISPETVGVYDLVFCGSVLLHLMDPVRALALVQSVTRGQAIVATAIHKDSSAEPTALFVGHHRGDAWWLPNRACLEAMVESAGFARWEWVSEFRLDYADGSPGNPHAVIRAWNGSGLHNSSTERPPAVMESETPETLAVLRHTLAERDAQIARLEALVAGYRRGRFMRLMEWLHRVRR
jgi:tRNA (mo5U34)-methyltransferase